MGDNMSWTDYDIVGSFNSQRISQMDCERTINMFEYIDSNDKKQKTLISTSGLVNKNISYPSAGDTDGFRVEFVFGGITYSVVGNHVYKQDAALVPTLIGTISNNTGFVGITANTYQIIIVNGLNGYIYDTVTSLNTSTAVIPITDTSFPSTPVDVTYLDGFFVVANGNTNNFQLSSFNQGLVWGPTGTITFTMAALSANIVLTGGITGFQVGTTVTFSGASIPTELANKTFYVKTLIGSTITVSLTDGGMPVTSTAGGSGNISNGGQLQLGSMTSHPGTIVACRTLHRRLFLFSQNFTEVWENAGIGTNLPFRRQNSLLIEYGTPAIGSIRVGFDSMFFLSQDQDGLGAVMQVNGTQPIPISTKALDDQLSIYAGNNQISDAYGILIKERGLIFYRLNFTAANHTFVYNVTMSDPSTEEGRKWHEEEVLNGDRHPAQTHVYFNGINYYGSYNSPTFYKVDPTVSTNDGEDIARIRIGRAECPPEYKRVRIDRFHLDVVQGDVDDIPNNVAPTIFLSYSKNGGQTFGNRMPAAMGKIGQFSYRTVWRKLGVVPRGQGFVPKIEFFNAVPFTILGAAWVFEILPE